ncbi:hypothetical protein CC78DRAFT_495542, partial [Lojkania enalia]
MAATAGPATGTQLEHPSPRSHDKPNDDADTCRICRGEGTADEPLFYPCKCSGSIKFVHQECLMEWLSHSQKKYCELCKTSFRFTKLYQPGMPSRIPTSVFLRRAGVHVLKMFMTWCRAVVVASVWLVLLPWCMRVVWRSLFWVGDGGWSRDLYSDEPTDPGSRIAQPWNVDIVRSALESARAANTSLPLPSFIMPFSQTLNMSASEPVVWTLLKRFFFGLSYPLTEFPFTEGGNGTSLNATIDSIGTRSPSLLSDVSFFNWLPSQAANGFLIDVLEGQIITLLVVVAFILIFLIREWVVQQQPVINMVALDNDHMGERAEDHEEPEPVDDTESENGTDEDGERIYQYVPPDATQNPAQPPDELTDNFPPIASSSQVFPARSSSLPQYIANEDEIALPAPPSPLQRSNMPARSQSSLATDVQRHLEEKSTWSFANAPQNTEDVQQQPQQEHAPIIWDHEEDASGPASKGKEVLSDPEQGSDHSSDSWQQIPDIIVDEITSVSEEIGFSANKGKAKALGDAAGDPPDDQHIGTPEMIPELFDPSTSHGSESVPKKHGEEDIAISDQSVCGSDSYRQESDVEGSQQATESQVEPEFNPGQGRPIAQPPRRFWDVLLDWLFGDVAPHIQATENDVNDEHIVEDLADEPPFVPFPVNEVRGPGNPPIQDPEVAAAAAQAGIDLNDQDAIDDAEDLEGIMELIGMQGPLTGLFQNAMFSAVLISATLACAVWFPYLWGKVVLLFVGSPVSIFVKLPLQFIAALADFMVDAVLYITAGAVFWLAKSLHIALRVCTWGSLFEHAEKPVLSVSGPARSILDSALDRLRILAVESVLFPHPDYFRLSINSHASLRTIQNTTSTAFNQTSNTLASLCEIISADSYREIAFQILRHASKVLTEGFATLRNATTSLGAWLWNSKSYKITLDFGIGQNATTTYIPLEQWTATDRLIAIFAGYVFFAMVGAFYLKRLYPISTSPQGRRIEGIIADVLQQAGGVLKVILIISIEMLVFPLYCGLLLDMALLPLFKNATLYTRWQFARENPWTSGFVHWFVGTCYMFHFALFVSMCRKIMRKGVLYFIRDPDDPTFHPVRDVLERSVSTQLRKIAFSALVYGALVIVCLGGVVWGLNRATSDILPIHWTSHAPSLEFPLDLLFYNFLTPLVVKLFKPGDSLHVIYRWWFKSCAGVLRLSNFLFGEKVKEEEGRHIRRTWSSWFAREKGNPEKPVIGEDRRILAEDRGTRVYFLFDGKYVRAPASDQVRIPKGEKVFVEVDRNNNRKDGKPEEEGVHNSDMVTMVYIPPWFRVRIALFVLAIWAFAATTGIGVTIVPLLFGRFIFSFVLPTSVEMNDIHAFSLGAYALGTITYGICQLYKCASTFHRPLHSPVSALWTVATTVSRFGLRILRFGYVWTCLVFVIPFLFALLLELYFLIPLHAYLGPREPHVVHVIQDWTLGFLYARLAARIVFSNRASRAARAFSAVVADGYMNPNAWLATRCFLLPVLAIFTIAITVPSIMAFTLNRTIWIGASDVTRSQVWRFSFPLLGLGVVAVWAGKEGVSMLNRWRMIVRDEVYLIGERLHNFGERKA